MFSNNFYTKSSINNYSGLFRHPPFMLSNVVDYLYLNRYTVTASADSLSSFRGCFDYDKNTYWRTANNTYNTTTGVYLGDEGLNANFAGSWVELHSTLPFACKK